MNITSECQHRWKKWEKEEPWYIQKDNRNYYQRRECKACGLAEWRTIEVNGEKLT